MVTVTSPAAEMPPPLPSPTRRVSRDRAVGDRHVAIRRDAAAVPVQVTRDRAGGDRHVAISLNTAAVSVAEFPEIVLVVTVTSPVAQMPPPRPAWTAIAEFPEIVLWVTVRHPKRRCRLRGRSPHPARFCDIVLLVTLTSPAEMPPPRPPAVFPEMVLEVTVRSSTVRIAPPSPSTSPPISLRPPIVTGLSV